MSSNEINIASDDNATLTELGTADIEALRDDPEPPNAELLTNNKKRKAKGNCLYWSMERESGSLREMSRQGIFIGRESSIVRSVPSSRLRTIKFAHTYSYKVSGGESKPVSLYDQAFTMFEALAEEQAITWCNFCQRNAIT